jgi:cytosine/adenosine deaminase-related metal-dependent hydrolase
MDDDHSRLTGVDVHIADGVIAGIGSDLDVAGAQIINVAGRVITPGLVNTHHHLYQTLTRAVPGGQDALLFGWLQTLYPIWSHFGPEEMFISAQVGLAELALSGCTMTSDHLYLYPNGSRLDDTIAAAGEVGMRFHPTRGAMSIGVSDGGLPPDALVEQEAAILDDCIRVIDAFHDPSEGAMTRVGVAPCSPFSVSRDLMRDAAILARDKGVMLHTHLAENDEDIAYSLKNSAAAPANTPRIWAGPAMTCGTHIVSSWTGKRLIYLRNPVQASRIAPVRTAAWVLASPLCARCVTRASRLALAWMDRQAMTLVI